jgi:hypothetical protein
MVEPKLKPDDQSVTAFLDKISDEAPYSAVGSGASHPGLNRTRTDTSAPTHLRRYRHGKLQENRKMRHNGRLVGVGRNP